MINVGDRYKPRNTIAPSVIVVSNVANGMVSGTHHAPYGCLGCEYPEAGFEASFEKTTRAIVCECGNN